jgi:hypothetical protein
VTGERRDDEVVGVAGRGNDVGLAADEGKRGHRAGTCGERALAIGVVALPVSLDDIDVRGRSVMGSI